ncbi:MAG: glycosyltransferase family 2 protein, partial [Candidatus Glassbacteria bacterium]|nr:glycosyltransferase family 2 protein [Candidatus Glassbacteria bacterium]
MAESTGTTDSSPDLSVIIPMYNESDNVGRTIDSVRSTLRAAGERFEVICVDDGSSDNTRAELERIAGEHGDVRVVSYVPNRGRGHALRTGFSQARGKYLVSVDADLSYSPDQILNLLNRLRQPDRPDIVIGSPYMPGGRTEGVRPVRLFISRCANILLRQAMGRRYYTVTGIFRGYRREALDCFELYSD